MKSIHYSLTVLFLLQLNVAGQSGWVTQTSGTGKNLKCIYFTDSLKGYAAGISGTILKTTDGGSSWLDKSLPISDSLFGISFYDQSTGWVVGGIPFNGGSRIFKTTDAGLNWFEQTGGTTAALTSVFCINSDSVAAAGEYGKIILTYDSGNSWYSQTSWTIHVLFGIIFTDSITGIGVAGNPGTGLAGSIGRSTDGGVSWTKCTGTGIKLLTAVSFGDNHTGYAVGWGGTILKTTDGGINWNPQTSNVTSDLWSVSFTSPDTGTTVGADGTILKTTDGGINWIIQTSGTTSVLYGVFFIDTMTGWIVGNDGIILHTSSGGITGSERKGINDIPTEFLLSQNFPNPFNPSTKISWQSPAGCRTTLKIYNILGREVVTLVNEYRQAGKYEMEFNAEKLPSGVYFYKIQAGSFIQTKKMILLR
jgi:photosystem II stability/assembly factor-like uncharacterized protein